MVETKRSVKISVVILLIVSILGLAYGLNTVLAPEYPWISIRGGFSNQQLRHLSPLFGIDLAGASYYTDTLERMVGGLCLALTAGALIVLFTAYRKAEKWAWYYMLGVSVIGWVNTLILYWWYTIPSLKPPIIHYRGEPPILHAFKNPATNPVIIVGLILTVIGLLIPVKDFFRKNTQLE
jgi:hypothetical protein